MGFTSKQRRDIVMLRAFNRTYPEIAEYLNAEYALDVSDSQVGREVRSMAAEADATNPRTVFDRIAAKGYVEDVLGS